MGREQIYGDTVRKLKEIREELEQRQADMDALEDELEIEYSAIEEQRAKLDEREAELSSLKAVVKAEIRHNNPYHPVLNFQQKIYPPTHITDLLRVRVTVPNFELDEKTDRALITMFYDIDGRTQTACYAMSLGQFDYIDGTMLTGIVKETSERINEELWKVIKERKNG